MERDRSGQNLQHSIVNVLPVLVEINASNGHIMAPESEFKIEVLVHSGIEQDAIDGLPAAFD